MGRILIPLFLYEKKLLSSPMFYLSAYLEANRDVYYDRLLGISDHGDWTGWIEFFLTAVIQQANANISKAKAIHDLYEEMKLEVPRITRSQFAIRALDALFHLPFFTTAAFIRHLGIPRSSAVRIVNILIAEQFIVEARKSSGRQPSVFMFRPIVRLLEGSQTLHYLPAALGDRF